MLEKLKEKLSTIAAIIASTGAIIGAALTVEARYASAAELVQVKELAQSQLKVMRIEQQINVDLLRKQSIEDRLFELRLKEKQTSVDRALTDRYKDQLEEVNTRIKDGQKQILLSE